MIEWYWEIFFVMDLHIWMLIVLAMRVVRIVYSGLRVGHYANGIACIKWVMRVIFWCIVVHDSKSRDRLELVVPPHLIDWE